MPKAESFGLLTDFLRLQHFLILLAGIFIQNGLTKADIFWRHLDTFVLLDIFHTFFQGHLDLRNDSHRIITATGAHICQLLSFRCIYDQVSWFDMFCDNLTYINFFSRIHKK